MHSLDVEKIMDKLGSKYEAVVRMSIKANQIADGDVQVEREANEKVTTTAMKLYIINHNNPPAPAGDVKK